MLFQNGLPTRAAFDVFDQLPDWYYGHVERFARLHWTDWFINQAVFHVQLAAGQELERRKDGKDWVRGRTYRCTAALKALQRARKGAADDAVDSLAKRGLLPVAPSPDQAALIRSLDASSVDQLEATALELAPYIAASYAALDAFERIAEQDDPITAARLHRNSVDMDPYVVPMTKRLIVSHIDRMTAIYDRLAAAEDTSTY